VQHSPTATALSTSFILNHVPQQPRAEGIDYKIEEVIQQRMSRESKRLKKSSSEWLNSGNALIQQVKNAICVFLVLPGSAEAQVTSGGIVKRLLIAYFIGNIYAKNIKIRSRVSKL